MPSELEEIRAWVGKAHNDRRMAELALTQTPPITDAAAFHCQQAVEKLLKAYLTWRRQDFEKTHDLRMLIEACAALDRRFLQHQDAVEPLTAYAIRFRYPGPVDPSADEIRAGLEAVDCLEAFVLVLLPKEAV